MSAKWHPGQLLCVGFEGVQAPPSLLDRIGQGVVGGVILFARNIEGPEQLHRLTTTLRDAAPDEAALYISVDQEGGRVQRLRDPWTRWPPMRALGDHDDTDATKAVGAALGNELWDAGFHLDFAPCVDVDSNPDNPVIGDRSLGREPSDVARHAVALVEGMQGAGVAACAKHFPGHGDTSVDSHLDLPRLEHDVERLHKIELPPFRAMVEAEVAAVMTAHVLFPKIDPDRPATMSPDVLGILRDQLGFSGLVFTDDLEMGAVAKHFSVQDRALKPLEAGADVLLPCKHEDLQLELQRILEAAPDGTLERALERVVSFKAKWVDGGKRIVRGAPPYPAHDELAARVAGD